MTDLTRRSFFRIAAGAAITPVLAQVALALPSVPILYGEDIHDDTAALQALIDGDVVEFAKPELAKHAGWSGNVFRMPYGEFRLSESLVFQCGGRKNVVLDGQSSRLIMTGSREYPAITVKDHNELVVQHFTIDGSRII